MRRKICAIGNSQGVSIPVGMLNELDLGVGTEVDVTVDRTKSRIVIMPVKTRTYPEGIDKEFVSQVNDFIAKYEPALKELAQK
jgi:antitoxin component of MazEF toxin-antitoxin module